MFLDDDTSVKGDDSVGLGAAKQMMATAKQGKTLGMKVSDLLYTFRSLRKRKKLKTEEKGSKMMSYRKVIVAVLLFIFPGALAQDCNDQNACTTDSIVDGNCVSEVIVCDDEDPTTLDICLPSRSGCAYIDISFPYIDRFETAYEALIQSLDEDTYFYEDAPGVDLSPVYQASIREWINTEVIQSKTPFCYKKTYGHGFGEVLSACPPGKERIGALCYTPCEYGYSRQGTFDCQQICKSGWRDDGLYCRLAEYGRGAGFPWNFYDGFSNSGMFRRCAASSQGQQYVCEK